MFGLLKMLWRTFVSSITNNDGAAVQTVNVDTQF